MRIISAGKVICLVLFGLMVTDLHGQKFHHFDLRKVNLGFTMGLNWDSFWFTNQPNQVDGKPPVLLKRVELVNKPGITLGLITNIKIANHWDFRFLPNVSLEQRDLRFIFAPNLPGSTDSVQIRKVEASYLNMPLALKFKSDFHKVYRLYIMGGIQPSVNLASNKKVRNDPNLVKTDRWDISAFVGIGTDLYGEKLKLTPELRYHLGLNNLYIRDRTNFPSSITEIFSSTLVFTINFE